MKHKNETEKPQKKKEKTQNETQKWLNVFTILLSLF